MSKLQFDCRFRYPSGFQLDFAFQTEQAITALLGPSGVGKTTTLNLIAGLLSPSKGRITLGERVLFDSVRSVNVPIENRRIGFVFQDYQLFPHLTVEANLRYGFRRAKSQIDLPHLIEVLELSSLLHRYPQTLSGGQRQRVALGRAIASQPELLLLDEPVSALDQEFRDNVVEYLQRILAEFKFPILMVTHDIDTANKLGAALVRVVNKQP
jgi:molybdate transport system ATP-binding protein